MATAGLNILQVLEFHVDTGGQQLAILRAQRRLVSMLNKRTRLQTTETGPGSGSRVRAAHVGM